jgi:hypothetical protein
MTPDEKRPVRTDEPRPPTAPLVPASTAVIPRDALERVLARAMELQTASEDAPESVSEVRLAEIAREVGIDLTNLRQAMAEERARLPLSEDQHGFLLDAFGPGAVSAQRTVRGNPGAIIAKLETWMPRMETLTVRRRIGDRLSWEPRRDALGNFFRGLGLGGGRLDLVRADQVSAMVTAVDETRSVVHLDAELHGVRRTQRTLFVVLAMALLATFSVVTIPIWLLTAQTAVASIGTALVAAMTGGAGFALWRAIRRSYRQLAGRAHLRLEQLLDELEHGGMVAKPPGLLGQVRELMLGK